MATRVKEALQLKGISNEAVANILGVHRNTLAAMLETVLAEIFEALKFSGALIAMGAVCTVVTKCPVYQWLSECLFPGRYDW